MKFKKIITHAGTHHADELLAIAAILYFVDAELPIERTFNPTEEDLNDPEVIVLDVGRRFEPDLSNFDHHQDGEIPATNILVLEHLCEDNKLKDLLKKHIFSYVDVVDRGKVVEGKRSDIIEAFKGGASYEGRFSGVPPAADEDYENAAYNFIPNYEIPTFNSIIRNLNNLDDGFDIALQVTKYTLAATFAMSKSRIESEGRWSELEKRGSYAIQHDTNFIVGWREMAKEEGIIALISPNTRAEGAYQITSRDTDILKIPKHESQTFLHANQFIASYPDLESAVEHANHFFNE